MPFKKVENLCKLWKNNPLVAARHSPLAGGELIKNKLRPGRSRSQGKTMWEHFHHQADIGIRGIGKTLSEALEEGAAALMAVICSPETVEPKDCVEIECEADETDLLFADWINALIYEMDIRKMLFSRFEVQIEKHKLIGTAWGEKVDADRHELAVEVKAATFMELKAYKNNDGQWVAQCVVDV